MPMHTYGDPVDMLSLMEVANHYKLPVVEDAAESLGSTCQGQHTGTGKNWARSVSTVTRSSPQAVAAHSDR